MSVDTDLLPRLTDAAAGQARDASPVDAVDGMPCRWVVTPSDTASVSAVMRVASEHGLAVVVRGSGTKLGWGAPPERLDLVLDMTGLDALVEHEAGDLIAVVQAGRRLDALQQDLAGAGQWLAVDPVRRGTVGGLVATASTGPARLLYGPLRDSVIGATMVRADGVVARAGGKVVKNVAGYDLGKLLTGSFGTLGVLTQVAVRLQPIPEARRWVGVPVTSSSHAAELAQRVVHCHLVPTAAELEQPAGEQARLVVRLDGTAPGVAARTTDVVELLGEGAEVLDAPPSWWSTEPGERSGVLLKISHEVASLAAVLDAVSAAASANGLEAHLRASIGVGTMLVSLGSRPGHSTGTNAENRSEGADSTAGACRSDSVVAVVGQLRAAAPGFGGAVVVLEAPAEVKAAVDVWGPVRGLDLMMRVKEQFDPERLLSPGRFVGGI